MTKEERQEELRRRENELAPLVGDGILYPLSQPIPAFRALAGDYLISKPGSPLIVVRYIDSGEQPVHTHPPDPQPAVDFIPPSDADDESPSSEASPPEADLPAARRHLRAI